ncbi:MAG: Flp pilus assembly complex ATPase component TadA [Gammaproteobacteria bacterium]|nr:Flp pilus assembly complex ATPase component TadA [Gammaproteobacteria bacterium]
MMEGHAVVQYVNQILSDAVAQGASDIHFEPHESSCRIRYRQDGVLRQVASPALTKMPYIISRIKVLANLDISERRIPQDGRFKFVVSKDSSVDFRVSTCPLLYGEKLVIRVLSTVSALPKLEELGMLAEQRQLFFQALSSLQGLILVCGATGSGKTVTLYTALRQLNSSEKNISSVEDPVEIPLSGINQVAVNSKTGLDFSTILRALLRQDPDVMMVGEIRDAETAEIAVKAAQTGHLVLSTLHTNSAQEAVLRLANMGVAPFNIMSSLVLVIAQRLVRKLCVHCKQYVEYPRSILLEAGFLPHEIDYLKLYRASECEYCYRGYKGRVGVFQVMPISENMRQLMLLGADIVALTNRAQEEKIMSVYEAGLEKVREGITSLEELYGLG